MTTNVDQPALRTLATPTQIADVAKILYPKGAPAQRYRPFICPFEEIIRFVPFGARVLDVGCGSGLLLGLIAMGRSVERGVGFDPSASAVSRAEQMASRLPGSLGEHLEFRCSAEELLLSSERFDVVSMIDVMHHIPQQNQRTFFEKIATKVNPGGIFLYKDMCSRPLWRSWANRMHDLVMARQWIHYLPVQQLEEWAMVTGLSLKHSRSINRLWYGHELRVFECPAE